MATALAAWCGWGIARLALPESLQRWVGLLAPLLGYCLVLVVGYWIVRDWVGLWGVLLVVLLLGGIFNLLAWQRTGPPRIQPRREQLPVLILLVVTLLVGVAPLISYGYPAIIGGNWDVENYLPTARYLERAPVSAIATAPPNPLRDLNAFPPSKGLTLGFSIWQGSVDLLTGSEAITTFAIILAWLRMMGVGAVYILFRSIMGLTRGYALLGAAFVSAGALLLWVELFNFGMQMSAWPLIPLGLVVGIAAAQDTSNRGVRSAHKALPVLAGAGLAISALPVAYYPALTLFGPLAVGLGLAVLVRSNRRAQLLASAVVMALFAIVFAIPTIGAYFEGFSFRYGEKLTTLGLFRYVPLTDFVGFTPFDLRAPKDVSVPVEGWLGLLALASLMVADLALGKRRDRWIGLVLGAAAYMAWLRWGQEYPYAYMKGGAYAAFPFLGLAAAGLQALGVKRETRNVKRDYRSLVTGHWSLVVGVALLVFMGIAQNDMLSGFLGRPRLYTAQMPDLLSLRQQIPAGIKVTYTSDPRIDTVTNGLAAYMLDHTTMLGSAQTGYSAPWSNGDPDDIGDFGLLSFQEDPSLLGFSPEGRIWQGGSFVLYRKPDDVKAHLPLNRTLNQGEIMELSLGQDDLSEAPAALPGGQKRQVQLSLASFTGGSVLVDGGISFSIPPGGSTLVTPVLGTPHKLTLRNDGRTPLTISAATLREPGQHQIGAVIPQPMTVLAHARSSVQGQAVATSIDTLAPNIGPVALEVDIWDTPRGLHYGSYGVEQPRVDAQRSFTLTLDLPSGRMTSADDKGAALPLGATFEGLKPGDYAARLNIKAGTRLLATSGDLFTFSVSEGGAITNVSSKEAPTLATSADRPLTPLADTRVGEDVKLLGYALGDKEVEPGNLMSITLWWEVMSDGLDERSVLLHLRDAKGEKKAQGDGPPANGGRPTSTWRKGEVIIDHHTIEVPPDTPEGSYNLAVGMYRFPSLEQLPISQGDKALESNVLLVSVEVKR